MPISPREDPRPLFVDGRVGSAELVPVLTERWRMPVRTVQLDAADFAFKGNGPKGEVQVGIERKTIGDLVSSMLGGRLSAHQLPALLRDYDYVWLVVEGYWRPGMEDELEVNGIGRQREHTSTYIRWMPSRSRVTYSQVNRYLATLEVMGTVKIRRTCDTLETAAMIVDLYNWWQKDWRAHRAHDVVMKMPVPAKVLTRTLTQLRKTAASLPGLGADRSRLAEAHFESIFQLMNADVNEWRRAGLGMADSRRVVRAIHEKYRNGRAQSQAR